MHASASSRFSAKCRFAARALSHRRVASSADWRIEMRKAFLLRDTTNHRRLPFASAHARLPAFVLLIDIALSLPRKSLFINSKMSIHYYTYIHFVSSFSLISLSSFPYVLSHPRHISCIFFLDYVFLHSNYIYFIFKFWPQFSVCQSYLLLYFFSDILHPPSKPIVRRISL